jgi:hypothetical protein
MAICVGNPEHNRISIHVGHVERGRGTAASSIGCRSMIG